jgi:hypothetical protein
MALARLSLLEVGPAGQSPGAVGPPTVNSTAAYHQHRKKRRVPFDAVPQAWMGLGPAPAFLLLLLHYFQTHTMDIETSLGGGKTVPQFSVFLLNRAGALFSLVKLLADRGISVLGLSIEDGVDVSIGRIVVSDPESAEPLFMERGIPYGMTELVVIELPEGVDDLTKSLSTLLSGETNINFMYPLLVRPNGRPVIAMHVEDAELAGTVLTAEGFTVLSQSDLSR